MNISKSDKYFKEVLKKREDIISTYPIKFEKFNEKLLDKFKIALAMNLLDVIHIKYSIVTPKLELKKDIPEIIDLLDKHWHPDLVRFKTGRKPNYLNMYLLEYNFFLRKLLSFMVLLDIGEKYFEIIKNLIDRDKVRDGIYDYLLSFRFEDRIISKTVYPASPKNNIMDIVFEKNPDTSKKLIGTYLEKQWYKTYKNAGFYNTHKLPEERYAFYGYWAFEVAAIVKLKDLDDISFRDNYYYPKDLV